jgi:glycosyltransferase involved in cell wall biosynthesis
MRTNNLINITIALHGPPSSNSGYHVIGLSRELGKMGFSVTICVPSISLSCTKINWADSIKICTFSDYLMGNGEPPSLFHAWTPRQMLVDFYLDACRRFGRRIPYIVHLEDNEELLVQSQLGIFADEYDNCKAGYLNLEVPKHLTHPFHGWKFVSLASGITALNATLAEEIPIGIPRAIFWPGYDDTMEWAVEVDESFRTRAGVEEHYFITTYTGNVHSVNVNEVRSLYLAVALVNRRGIPLKLVRTGQDCVPLAELGEELLRKNSINLGFIDRGDLPKLIAIADILIQPGQDDDWNRYRVPSKLPEYLASGKPVIAPNVNLGKELLHEKEAIILGNANAENLAHALEMWLPRKEKLAEIGANGRLFAKRNLQWSIAAQKVFRLYQTVLSA